MVGMVEKLFFNEQLSEVWWYMRIKWSYEVLDDNGSMIESQTISSDFCKPDYNYLTSEQLSSCSTRMVYELLKSAGGRWNRDLVGLVSKYLTARIDESQQIKDAIKDLQELNNHKLDVLNTDTTTR